MLQSVYDMGDTGFGVEGAEKGSEVGAVAVFQQNGQVPF